MSGLRGMRIFGAGMIGAVLFVGPLETTIASAQSAVVGSPHDMAGRAVAAPAEICAYCHVPEEHDSPVSPLWAGSDSNSQRFGAYAHPARIEPDLARPLGTTLVCLSCHDAIIAPDVASALPVSDGRDSPPSQPSNFTRGHPVSATYSGGNALGMKLTHDGKAGDLPLFGASPTDGPRVECPSCHNPHEIVFGKFLRVSSKRNLCRNCHVQ